MSNYENIKALIQTFSGQDRTITIPVIYIEMLGDLNTAALLNQIIFWSDKTSRKDGFFYKTYKDWEEELTLSEYQVRNSVKKLKEKNLVETKLKRANGSPTLHYRLDYKVLQDSILKELKNRNTSISSNEAEETKESLTVDYHKTTSVDNNNNNSPAKAERIPYKKIIDYLNQEADRQFSHVADSNKRLIRARWNELKKTHKDISEEDLLKSFKKVIDNKVEDAKDTKHFFTEEYLRPSTLFSGSNFDKYLNQPPRKNEKEVNNIGQPEF